VLGTFTRRIPTILLLFSFRLQFFTRVLFPSSFLAAHSSPESKSRACAARLHLRLAERNNRATPPYVPFSLTFRSLSPPFLPLTFNSSALLISFTFQLGLGFSRGFFPLIVGSPDFLLLLAPEHPFFQMLFARSDVPPYFCIIEGPFYPPHCSFYTPRWTAFGLGHTVQ